MASSRAAREYAETEYEIAQQAPSGEVRLSVLNYIPRIPPIPEGVKTLRLNMVDITEFPILPESLEILELLHTKLKAIPKLPPNLKSFLCGWNYDVTHIEAFSSTLEVLYIESCPYLKSLPELPPTLQRITLAQLPRQFVMPALDTLSVLKRLKIDSAPELTTLPSLPDSLEELSISAAPLFNSLPEPLPSHLQELYIYGTQLTKLPSLPADLRRLIVNNNNLADLPELPEGLRELIASKNQIRILPYLPASLETVDPFYLDFDRNPLDPMYGSLAKQLYLRRITPSQFVRTSNELLRRLKVKQEAKNLAGLSQTIGSTRGNLFLGPRAATGLRRVPANVFSHIGSFLTGQEGNLATQRLKVRESATRHPNQPGASRRGGRRSRRTRKSRKTQRRR